MDTNQFELNPVDVELNVNLIVTVLDVLRIRSILKEANLLLLEIIVMITIFGAARIDSLHGRFCLSCSLIYAVAY